MGNFVFQDLEHFPKTVWREGDPPLINGTGPVVDAQQPDPKPRSLRPLLWLGVIACIAIGARLVALLLTRITDDLRLASAPLTIRPTWITICVSAWVGLCLLAIVRAWRHHA